jgi:serine/threonine protein phosphatase PrpC
MQDTNTYSKQYYQDNKQKWDEYNQKRYSMNGVAIANYLLGWRKNNKDKVSQYSKKNYEKHKEQNQKNHREYTRRLKETVLTHYGNGEMKCVLCGFDNPHALTIDHINGNGATHRRAIGGGGVKTYLWLRRNDYPAGYRTLCANCQLIEYLGKQQGVKPPQ